MSLYKDKLAEAIKLIDNYNRQIKIENLGKRIEVKTFVYNLQRFGAISDELLRQVTWEDLEDCGLPRLLARTVAKVFRAKNLDPKNSVQNKIKNVHYMNIKELLLAYDPVLDQVDEVQEAVRNRLLYLTKTPLKPGEFESSKTSQSKRKPRRCIVFTKDKKVNIEVSEEIIKYLMISPDIRDLSEWVSKDGKTTYKLHYLKEVNKDKD